MVSIMNGKKLSTRNASYEELAFDWDAFKRATAQIDAMTDEEVEAEFNALMGTSEKLLDDLENGRCGSLDYNGDIEELKTRLRGKIAK